MFRTMAVCGAMAIVLVASRTLAGPVVFFGGTGSYYQCIEMPLTWDEARDASAAATYLGRAGRLATITSNQENDFIVDHVIPNHFNGDSYWLGGLQPPGSPEPDGGWRWITDEPFVYTKWRPADDKEPNDALGGEDRIQLFNRIQDGTWVDVWHDNVALTEGYVIEFAPAGSAVPLPAALPAGAMLMALAAAVRQSASR
jgi:hypothetical protein